MSSRLRCLLAAALVAVGVALPACNSSDAPADAAQTTTTMATPSPSPSPSPSTISGLAREAANPDPNFDYGFTVQVAASGLRPHWLVAACCQPITWRNLSSATVSVVFDHLAISSGPIPPGGTYVFTPENVESIAYHLAGTPRLAGVVQVNPTIEP